MTFTEDSTPRLTPRKVRHLNAGDLHCEVAAPDAGGAELRRRLPPLVGSVPAVLDIEQLDSDDPILDTVKDLLTTYGGVIFTGPPGTSKSFYAARVGATLVAGDASRFRLVQFHPSYQYEDFVEGFVPRDNGTYELRQKHFLQMCQVAAYDPKDRPVVLVIDELSRGDPGRVFGEALTYIDKTRRGITFSLASGREAQVPPNLVILATMNPLDRGVDEVDAALERRFGKYAMEPNPDVLETLLSRAGMGDELRNRVLTFFRRVNARARSNPHAALGHTYFLDVSDEAGLRRLWEHQLRFHFDKAYRLDASGLAEIYSMWDWALAVAPTAPDTTIFGSEPGETF